MNTLCVICGAPNSGTFGLGPCANGHTLMEQAYGMSLEVGGGNPADDSGVRSGGVVGERAGEDAPLGAVTGSYSTDIPNAVPQGLSSTERSVHEQPKRGLAGAAPTGDRK